MRPVQLPRECVWRGYRLLRRADMLECEHHGVYLRVFVNEKVPDKVFATITMADFVGTGEGESEKVALANALKEAKSRLRARIRDGKQAECDLDRLRTMF